MRNLIGSGFMILTLLIIGGEFHITVSSVVSTTKMIYGKVAPEVHVLAQEIVNNTKNK